MFTECYRERGCVKCKRVYKVYNSMGLTNLYSYADRVDLKIKSNSTQTIEKRVNRTTSPFIPHLFISITM